VFYAVRHYNMPAYTKCKVAQLHQMCYDRRSPSAEGFSQNGTKRIHLVAPEHGENVTIVPCGSAAGNVVPLMVIFKGKTRKSALANDLPPGSSVQMTEKRCMTTDVFIQWIQHFAKNKPNGDVLLISDGAASHLDLSILEEADKHQIHLFCLASNTTHELQLMDKCLFRAFEHYWDAEVSV